MSPDDLLLKLLLRFQQEGVEYILIGGQAVRLNGYLRATEDVDVLLRPTRENGERVKRAMDFLPSASELEADWFAADPQGHVENIRVADDLLVDLLFAANGETYASLRTHARDVELEGVAVKVLDIDGLLKTKTDYREKDLLDKQVLRRIQQQLQAK